MFFRRSTRPRASFSFRSPREEAPSTPIATWSSVLFVLVVGALAGRSIDYDAPSLTRNVASVAGSPRFALSRESANEAVSFTDPYFPREPESIAYSNASRPEIPSECPHCSVVNRERRIVQLPLKDSSSIEVSMPVGHSSNSLDLMFSDTRGGYWVVAVSPRDIALFYELPSGARTELSHVKRLSASTLVQRTESEIRVSSEPTLRALGSLSLSGEMVLRSSVQAVEFCSLIAFGQSHTQESRVELARGTCVGGEQNNGSVGGPS